MIKNSGPLLIFCLSISLSISQSTRSFKILMKYFYSKPPSNFKVFCLIFIGGRASSSHFGFSCLFCFFIFVFLLFKIKIERKTKSAVYFAKQATRKIDMSPDKMFFVASMFT